MPTQTVNMPDGTPSRKVVAASAASVVAGFVLWLLDEYLFGGATPEPVVLLVMLVIPAALTFAAGYVTKRSVGELTHD